jgi:hypothetical protein
MSRSTSFFAALIIAFLTASPAQAEWWETHLGKSLRNHVVLVWGAGVPSAETVCEEPNKGFVEISPDGTWADEAFVVPPGKVLVVTDLDVVIVAGTGETFDVGRTVYATLVMEALVGSSHVPYQTPGVPITHEGLGAVSISSNLGAGALIGPGQQVCVTGEQVSASGGRSLQIVNRATVRGYLMPEPR